MREARYLRTVEMAGARWLADRATPARARPLQVATAQKNCLPSTEAITGMHRPRCRTKVVTATILSRVRRIATLRAACKAAGLGLKSTQSEQGETGDSVGVLRRDRRHLSVIDDAGSRVSGAVRVRDPHSGGESGSDTADRAARERVSFGHVCLLGDTCPRERPATADMLAAARQRVGRKVVSGEC